MECYICANKLENKYLCTKCYEMVIDMLQSKSNIVTNPKWEQHCLICGEYKDRIIIDVPNCGPICNRCVYNQNEI